MKIKEFLKNVNKNITETLQDYLCISSLKYDVEQISEELNEQEYNERIDDIEDRLQGVERNTDYDFDEVISKIEYLENELEEVKKGLKAEWTLLKRINRTLVELSTCGNINYLAAIIEKVSKEEV